MLDKISTHVPDDLQELVDLESRLGAVVAALKRIDTPGSTEMLTTEAMWQLAHFAWEAEVLANYARVLSDGITEHRRQVERLTHGMATYQEESAAA